LGNRRGETPKFKTFWVDRDGAARFEPLKRRRQAAGADRSLIARLLGAFGYINASHRSRFVTSSAKTRPGQIRARMSAGAFAFLLLIAVGASACGRRGALEPPPDPNAVAKAANEDPNRPQIAHKPKPVVPPKEPFVLDPLL
jgi:hypothetical protein